MLALDGYHLLGRAPETCPLKKVSWSESEFTEARRQPAGSRFKTGLDPTRWEVAHAGGAGAAHGYRLFVARALDDRRRAYRLAYRVYREHNYITWNREGMAVSPFDADPETFTLLIEDLMGREVATVSLNFDSPAGLPCEEIFSAELAVLRAPERRLVEVTRLAIAQEHAHAKTLLVHLFNFISVYARRLGGGTDFVIEVNPRHVGFYRRLLLFQPVGPERKCPRVNGAPAVLMRLDLAEQAREIERTGGSEGVGHGPHGRTMYSSFCAYSEEPRVAAFLEAQPTLH